jgi:hypothetical protein
MTAYLDESDTTDDDLSIQLIVGPDWRQDPLKAPLMFRPGIEYAWAKKVDAN